MKKRLLLGIFILVFSIFLTACNGNGNLRLNIYDQQQNLKDDVYVGLYTSDFNNRLTFAYTMDGEVKFKGLRSGVYGIKVVYYNLHKKFKVKVKGQETNYIKVNLN